MVSPVFPVCDTSLTVQQSCQSLHGDIPQKQREITLKGFRSGTFEVLVATNVAARGLDIPEIDLVVQCSPPKVWYCFLPQTYLCTILGVKAWADNYVVKCEAWLG